MLHFLIKKEEERVFYSSRQTSLADSSHRISMDNNEAVFLFSPFLCLFYCISFLPAPLVFAASLFLLASSLFVDLGQTWTDLGQTWTDLGQTWTDPNGL